MSYTERHGAPAWPCAEPGCTRTGHQKPVCTRHLDRLPYVQKLLAEVERGAVDTVSVECAECGESFDRHKAVTKSALCQPCRREREADNHRARQAKYRQSRAS